MTVRTGRRPRAPGEFAATPGGRRVAVGLLVVAALVALLLVWLWSGWQTRYSRQVVLGLSSGSLYALLALAIVTVYRATAIVNFAQGEMAVLSTFLAWSVLQRYGDGGPAAPWIMLVVTVAVGFLLGAAVEYLVIRRVGRQTALDAAVVAIALFLIFNSVSTWAYGAEPKAVPSIFGRGTVDIGAATVTVHALGTIAISLGVMAAVFALFQFTRLGLAMRATAEDQVAARLVGVRVEWMLTLGWGLAGAVGALAGVLIAHSLNLSPILMFEILLFALAATVLGGISSPGGAVLGGFLVGVAQNVLGVTDFLGGTQLRLFWAFAFIVLVLLLWPAGIFGRRAVRRL